MEKIKMDLFKKLWEIEKQIEFYFTIDDSYTISYYQKKADFLLSMIEEMNWVSEYQRIVRKIRKAWTNKYCNHNMKFK